jgi:hypothetical protein
MTKDRGHQLERSRAPNLPNNVKISESKSESNVKYAWGHHPKWAKIEKAKKNPVDELEKLAERRKKATKGYRRALHEIIAETMRNVAIMRSDAAALQEFVGRYKFAPNESGGDAWITSAAFNVVHPVEKEAWKWARVACFLHDFKVVPIESLAEEIHNLGGIAAVVGLAAKQDPRRAEAKVKKPARTKLARRRPGTKKVGSAATGENDRGPTDDELADEEIVLRVDSNCRVQLSAMPTDQRVEIIAVVVHQDELSGALLAIERVRRLD